METKKITDPVRAQAAIAFLISEGWQIDLAALNKEIPGGLTPADWLRIANGCLDYCMDRLAEDKVVPIGRFRK
jgi:hypothetical protein